MKASRGWITMSLGMLSLGIAGNARANEFEDFQKAQSVYEALDYDLAADLFEQLVGTDPPRLQDPALVVESRKYLAASHLFLGHVQQAEREIERLLRAEPDYVLDPLAFPDELQRMFGRVKARLAAARDAAAQATAEAGRRKTDEEVQRLERERIRELVRLARTERVQRVQSRWVGMIPFGVGQFQNNDSGLGVGFAVSEGLLFSVGIASFLLHEDLRDQSPSPGRRRDAELAESAFRHVNQISMTLFGLLAVAGVIEAQLEFDESRTIERQRRLPAWAEDWAVLPTPTGLAAAGTF